jgi:DNA-binding NarL/FixJ family response regulator
VSALGTPSAAAPTRDEAEPRAPLQPEEAARIWRGLATGQWHVVAATEEEGTRRLTLARAPQGAAVDWGRLTACERRVVDQVSRGTSQKVIALELRWSKASVCETLHRVRERFGFATLAQLGRSYRAHHSPPPRLAEDPKGREAPR